MFIGDDEIMMVTSDRLSAFDVVLTDPLQGRHPQQHHRGDVPRHRGPLPEPFDRPPHPNVLQSRADPIAAEIIVRRYITGSLWRPSGGEAGVTRCR